MLAAWRSPIELRGRPSALVRAQAGPLKARSLRPVPNDSATTLHHFLQFRNISWEQTAKKRCRRLTARRERRGGVLKFLPRSYPPRFSQSCEKLSWQSDEQISTYTRETARRWSCGICIVARELFSAAEEPLLGAQQPLACTRKLCTRSFAAYFEGRESRPIPSRKDWLCNRTRNRMTTRRACKSLQLRSFR